MGCFVVAECLLTSASRGPSAIGEPLVIQYRSVTDKHTHIHRQTHKHTTTAYAALSIASRSKKRIAFFDVCEYVEALFSFSYVKFKKCTYQVEWCFVPVYQSWVYTIRLYYYENFDTSFHIIISFVYSCIIAYGCDSVIGCCVLLLWK